MRRAIPLLLAIPIAGALPAEPPLIPLDPPVASRPAAGDVTGRITPPAKIARLYAVCRATGRRYEPGRFDRKTGAFVFRSLPGDATYDVGVVTTEGARLEGIDLSWHEARMLRLAAIRRQQLQLPPEPAHRFNRDDVEELLAYVRDLRDFTDVRRALYLRGHGRRATMLVEVMRVRDFYAKRGAELIWRTELWYFQYQYGGWERVANVERVLERHRIQRPAWEKITLIYDPRLSACVDETGRAEPVTFRIPERLDPARGRIAGTEPVQKTRPIVLGLAEAADAPASRPASER